MTIIEVPPIVTLFGPLDLDAPTYSVEPIVHGIVGAQYGDLEFDVGKSVRWLEYYCDDVFIVDINTGDQRYWVVNWAESFPNAEHIVTGRNFFYDTAQAALFRKEQFEQADKKWGYGAEDWVIFVDAHEGLSFDNRTLPNDYQIEPFLTWMYREIERAKVAGRNYAVVPFFVYLDYRDLQNVTYGTEANRNGAEFGIPAVNQAVSVPEYLPAQGLTRLWKVSALRAPAFDWTLLDRPVAPSPNVKIQIISYAYAHWNIQDIVPPATEVAPLNASNDDGWRMRNLISRVRPIAGIPYGDVWQDPSTDPAGLPGPWCVDTVTSVAPGIETTVEEDGHTATNAATAGLRVPLYDTVMRLNLRDGLWYERGASGNMPLAWDDVNGVWVPRYDPAQWEQLGVSANQEPPPPPSNMSLRLNGTAGTFTRTADANYFDYQNAFTLVGVIALDDWTPSTRQGLVSKWTAAGQRSYYWALDAGGGMVLVTSRDGTASIEKKVTFSPAGEPPVTPTDPMLALTGGQPAGIAVSFVTNLSVEPFQDEVRFWLWDAVALRWDQIGDALVEPNPDNLPIFSSTSEVQIGAVGGSMNAAGLFRAVSIRQGIGEDQALGGIEYARMRGDITANPAYDRYGNLWANYGGWSYVLMTDPPDPFMA